MTFKINPHQSLTVFNLQNHIACAALQRKQIDNSKKITLYCIQFAVVYIIEGICFYYEAAIKVLY